MSSQKVKVLLILNINLKIWKIKEPRKQDKIKEKKR